MLSAVPELDASVEEQQAFMGYMSDASFNDELESIDKVVTKAKQTVTKMALATSAAKLATSAEDIKRGKNFTASCAAIALLRNPSLAKTGEAGAQGGAPWPGCWLLCVHVCLM